MICCIDVTPFSSAHDLVIRKPCTPEAWKRPSTASTYSPTRVPSLSSFSNQLRWPGYQLLVQKSKAPSAMAV